MTPEEQQYLERMQNAVRQYETNKASKKEKVYFSRQRAEPIGPYYSSDELPDHRYDFGERDINADMKSVAAEFAPTERNREDLAAVAAMIAGVMPKGGFKIEPPKITPPKFDFKGDPKPQFRPSDIPMVYSPVNPTQPKSKGLYVEGTSTPGPWSTQFANSGLTHEDVASFGELDDNPWKPSIVDGYMPKKVGGPRGQSRGSYNLPADAKGVEDLISMKQDEEEAAPTREKMLNLKPLLALADSWAPTRSNLAGSYDDPNIAEDARVSKLEYLKLAKEKNANDKLRALAEMLDKREDNARKDKQLDIYGRVANARVSKLGSQGDADPLKEAQHIGLMTKAITQYEEPLNELVSLDPTMFPDVRTANVKIYNKSRQIAKEKGVNVPTAYNAVINNLVTKAKAKADAE